MLEIKDEFREFKEFRAGEERIAQALANALKLPYFDLEIIKPEVDALKYIPKEQSEKLKVIPIKKERNSLILGVIDPYNPEFIDLKKRLEKLGLNIQIGIISNNSLNIGLEEYKFISQKKTTYVKSFSIDKNIIQEIISKESLSKDEFRKILENFSKEDSFLILDYLLAGAIKLNSSDIHFEPSSEKAIIRFRIDGILYEIFNFDFKIYNLIKNRIKVLSGMMLNIKDKPQDGRFSINIESSKNIDVRVSIIPSAYEEAIVLRILNFENISSKLEDLGIREDDLEILNESISAPNGLILNTGPTGSGKTTTLYAILLKIKKPGLKIITIENPIEYSIEGISQSQVDENRGFTFSSALRAFLRHDPDVILVGEIRDKETATTSIQASLTGHLVLSTLHTNSSLGAVPRLISLEVDPELIPPALRLVIAQRLVRKLCSFCKESYKPDETLKNKIKNKLSNLPSRVKIEVNLNDFALYKSKGCEKCFQTGYKGRIGIFELLKMTKELEQVIYKKPSETEILEAVKNDFISLQQDAIIKAILGFTSIEEVERITGLI